jgi:hypothetical protein
MNYTGLTNIRDIGRAVQDGQQGVLPPTEVQKGILGSSSTHETLSVGAEAAPMLQAVSSATRPAEFEVRSPILA